MVVYQLRRSKTRYVKGAVKGAKLVLAYSQILAAPKDRAAHIWSVAQQSSVSSAISLGLRPSTNVALVM